MPGKMKGNITRMPNMSFDDLGMDSIHIKNNQGKEFENPKAKGKNNIFDSGVKAF